MKSEDFDVLAGRVMLRKYFEEISPPEKWAKLIKSSYDLEVDSHKEGSKLFSTECFSDQTIVSLLEKMLVWDPSERASSDSLVAKITGILPNLTDKWESFNITPKKLKTIITHLHISRGLCSSYPLAPCIYFQYRYLVDKYLSLGYSLSSKTNRALLALAASVHEGDDCKALLGNSIPYLETIRMVADVLNFNLLTFTEYHHWLHLTADYSEVERQESLSKLYDLSMEVSRYPYDPKRIAQLSLVE